MITLRSSLISLLLLIATSLSFWSIFISSKSSPIVIESKPDQPDAFMEEVLAIIMDKQGKPRLRLESPIMFHYKENDVTELTTPHVTIFRQSPQPWHINAKHGKTHKGVTEITFWDNVVIHHLEDSDNPFTTIKTPTLTIIPDQHVAKTHEAITVTQPDTKIDAIGMLANWNDGTVKLLSQAREEYAPHS